MKPAFSKRAVRPFFHGFGSLLLPRSPETGCLRANATCAGLLSLAFLSVDLHAQESFSLTTSHGDPAGTILWTDTSATGWNGLEFPGQDDSDDIATILHDSVLSKLLDMTGLSTALGGTALGLGELNFDFAQGSADLTWELADMNFSAGAMTAGFNSTANSMFTLSATSGGTLYLGGLVLDLNQSSNATHTFDASGLGNLMIAGDVQINVNAVGTLDFNGSEFSIASGSQLDLTEASSASNATAITIQNGIFNTNRVQYDGTGDGDLIFGNGAVVRSLNGGADTINFFIDAGGGTNTDLVFDTGSSLIANGLRFRGDNLLDIRGAAWQVTGEVTLGADDTGSANSLDGHMRLRGAGGGSLTIDSLVFADNDPILRSARLSGSGIFSLNIAGTASTSSNVYRARLIADANSEINLNGAVTMNYTGGDSEIRFDGTDGFIHFNAGVTMTATNRRLNVQGANQIINPAGSTGTAPDWNVAYETRLDGFTNAVYNLFGQDNVGAGTVATRSGAQLRLKYDTGTLGMPGSSFFLNNTWDPSGAVLVFDVEQSHFNHVPDIPRFQGVGGNLTNAVPGVSLVLDKTSTVASIGHLDVANPAHVAAARINGGAVLIDEGADAITGLALDQATLGITQPTFWKAVTTNANATVYSVGFGTSADDPDDIYQGVAFTAARPGADADVDLTALTGQDLNFAVLSDTKFQDNLSVWTTDTGTVNVFGPGLMEIEPSGNRTPMSPSMTLNRFGWIGANSTVRDAQNNTILHLDNNNAAGGGAINIWDGRINFETTSSQVNVIQNATINIRDGATANMIYAPMPTSGNIVIHPGGALYINHKQRLDDDATGTVFQFPALAANENRLFVLDRSTATDGDPDIDNLGITFLNAMVNSDIVPEDTSLNVFNWRVGTTGPQRGVVIGENRSLMTVTDTGATIDVSSAPVTAYDGTIDGTTVNTAYSTPATNVGFIAHTGRDINIQTSVDLDYQDAIGGSPMINVRIGTVDAMQTIYGASNVRRSDVIPSGDTLLYGADTKLGNVELLSGRLVLGDGSTDVIRVYGDITNNSSIYDSAILGATTLLFNRGDFAVAGDLIHNGLDDARTEFNRLDVAATSPIVAGNLIINGGDVLIDGDDGTSLGSAGSNLTQALFDGFLANNVVIHDGGQLEMQISTYDSAGTETDGPFVIKQPIRITGDAGNSQAQAQLSHDIQGGNPGGAPARVVHYGDGTNGGITLANGAVLGIDEVDGNALAHLILDGDATITRGGAADEFDILSVVTTGSPQTLTIGRTSTFTTNILSAPGPNITLNLGSANVTFAVDTLNQPFNDLVFGIGPRASLDATTGNTVHFDTLIQAGGGTLTLGTSAAELNSDRFFTVENGAALNLQLNAAGFLPFVFTSDGGFVTTQADTDSTQGGTPVDLVPMADSGSTNINDNLGAPEIYTANGPSFNYQIQDNAWGHMIVDQVVVSDDPATGSHTLTLGGGINPAVLSMTGSADLEGATIAVGTLAFNGNSQGQVNVVAQQLAFIKSDIAGANGFAKTGGGQLELWGQPSTNLLSGNFELQGGTVRIIDPDILGSGTLVFSGANSSLGNEAGSLTTLAAPSGVIDNPITAPTGAINLGEADHITGAILTGAVDLGGVLRAVNVLSSYDGDHSYWEMRGSISNGGLQKGDPGRLILAGANTYDRGTLLREGDLIVRQGGTLGANVTGNDITIERGGRLLLMDPSGLGSNQKIFFSNIDSGAGGVQQTNDNDWPLLALGFNPGASFVSNVLETIDSSALGANPGVIALHGVHNFSADLDMNTLGNGNWYLSATTRNGAITGGSLTPSSTLSQYRFGGGEGTLTIDVENYLTGSNGLRLSQSDVIGSLYLAKPQDFTGQIFVDYGWLIASSNASLGAGGATNNNIRLTGRGLVLENSGFFGAVDSQYAQRNLTIDDDTTDISLRPQGSYDAIVDLGGISVFDDDRQVRVYPNSGNSTWALTGAPISDDVMGTYTYGVTNSLGQVIHESSRTYIRFTGDTVLNDAAGTEKDFYIRRSGGMWLRGLVTGDSTIEVFSGTSASTDDRGVLVLENPANDFTGGIILNPRNDDAFAWVIALSPGALGSGDVTFLGSSTSNENLAAGLEFRLNRSNQSDPFMAADGQAIHIQRGDAEDVNKIANFGVDRINDDGDRLNQSGRLDTFKDLYVAADLNIDGNNEIQVSGAHGYELIFDNTTTITLNANAAANPNVTFDTQSAKFTLAGQVTGNLGSGSLIKTGQHILALTNNANDFVGSLDVQDGTLMAAGDGSFGNAANTVTLGGTAVGNDSNLLIQGGGTITRAITVHATGTTDSLIGNIDGTAVTIGSDIALGRDMVFVDAGAANATVFSGAISGSGTGFTAVGLSGGLIELTGNNSFTGNAAVGAGTLRVTNALGNDPLATAAAVVVDGGTLHVKGDGAAPFTLGGAFAYSGGGRLQVETTSAPVTVNAFGLARQGSGTLTVIPALGSLNTNEIVHVSGVTLTAAPAGGGSAIVSPSVIAQASLADSAGYFLAVDGSNHLTVTGVYAGSGGLDTAAANTVWDANAASSGPLGSDLSLFSLRTNQAGDLGGNILTLGNGSDPGGLILNHGGSISNGLIQFGGSEGLVYAGGSGTATLGAGIAGGNGFTKFGDGRLELGPTGGMPTFNLDTFSGAVNVNQGTLAFAADSVFDWDFFKLEPRAFDVNLELDGTLDAGATTQRIGGITGGGTIHVAAGGVLTVNANNAATTFDGRLTGDGTIVKTATGRLILTNNGLAPVGSTTFSGDLVIERGQVMAYGSDPTDGTDTFALSSPLGTATLILRGGELELRSSGDLTTSHQDIFWGNNVIVDGGDEAIIDVNERVSGDDNKNHVLGDLTLNHVVLRIVGGNEHNLQFSGLTTLTGGPTTDNTARIQPESAALTFNGEVTDLNRGITLNKTSGDELFFNHENPDFSGGVILEDGTLQFGSKYGNLTLYSPTATAGTGHIRLNAVSAIRINTPDNIRDGQEVRVVSSVTGAGPSASAGTAAGYSRVDLQGDFTPEDVNLRSDHSGALALNMSGGSYSQPLDLSAIGNGNWGLAAMGTTHYTSSTLGSGAEDTYRFFGAGSALHITKENVVTGPNAKVEVGTRLGGWDAEPANTSAYVVFWEDQDYAGPTIIHGGEVGTTSSPVSLEIRKQLTGGGDIFAFGRLRTDGGGSFVDVDGTATTGSFIAANVGQQLNTVHLYPGSQLRFDFNRALGDYGSPAYGGYQIPNNQDANGLTNKWQDGLTLSLNGSALYLEGSADRDTTEKIGTLEISQGSDIQLVHGGNGQINLMIGDDPLAGTSGIVRVGQGTLTIESSSAEFGGGINDATPQTDENDVERIIFHNRNDAVKLFSADGNTITVGINGLSAAVDMVDPWIVNRTTNNFVTYDLLGERGFHDVTYTSSDLLSAGTTDIVDDANGATLSALTEVFALKLGGGNIGGSGQQLNILSGGLISVGSTRTIDANLYFGDGTTPIEGVIFNTGTTVLNGTITASALTKHGEGTLTIASSNPALNIPVQINRGELQLNQLDALGSSTVTLGGYGMIDAGGERFARLLLGASVGTGAGDYTNGIVLGKNVGWVEIEDVSGATGDIGLQDITFNTNSIEGQTLFFDSQSDTVHADYYVKGALTFNSEDLLGDGPRGVVYLGIDSGTELQFRPTASLVDGSGPGVDLVKTDDGSLYFMEVDSPNFTGDFTHLRGYVEIRTVASGSGAAADAGINALGNLKNLTLGSSSTFRLNFLSNEGTANALDYQTFLPALEQLRILGGAGAEIETYRQGTTDINIVKWGNSSSNLVIGDSQLYLNTNDDDANSFQWQGNVVLEGNANFHVRTSDLYINSLTGGEYRGTLVAGAVADGLGRGGFDFIKSGDSRISLMGENTFTGTLRIDQGLLELSLATSRATGFGGNVVINPGGTLMMRGVDNLANSNNQVNSLTSNQRRLGGFGVAFNTSNGQIFGSGGFLDQAAGAIAFDSNGTGVVDGSVEFTGSGGRLVDVRSGGVLAILTNERQIWEHADVAGSGNQGIDFSLIGDGAWSLGASTGNGELNNDVALAPGIDNIYRFGGGASERTPSLTLEAGGVPTFAGPADAHVLIGLANTWNSSIQLYLPDNFNDPARTGGTTITMSNVVGQLHGSTHQLVIQAGNDDKPLGTGHVNNYGYVRFEGADGSAISGLPADVGEAAAYVNANTWSFLPGSELRFENGTIFGPNGSGSPVLGGRWGDSVAIALNGATLRMDGDTVAQTAGTEAGDALHEVVGDLTFAGGSRILHDEDGVAQSITMATIARTSYVFDSVNFGFGTLLLDETGAKLGVSENVLVATTGTDGTTIVNNGMVSPWVVAEEGRSFATYTANGFERAAPDLTTSGTISTGDVTATQKVFFDGATTLNGSIDLYALQFGDDDAATRTLTGNGHTITIHSGGVIAYDNGARTHTLNNVNLDFTQAPGGEGIVWIRDSDDGLVLAGSIFGDRVTKFGFGVLQLQADNPHFDGQWNVNQGTLMVRSLEALGSGDLFLNGYGGYGAEVEFNVTFDTIEKRQFTMGRIVALDNNRIEWVGNIDERTAGIGPIDLITSASIGLALDPDGTVMDWTDPSAGGSGTGLSSSLQPGQLRFSVSNNKNRLETGLVTMHDNYDILVDAISYQFGASGTVAFIDGLDNDGRFSLTKTGDGVLELPDISGMFTSANAGAGNYARLTVSGGTLRVLHNGSLGAADVDAIMDFGSVLEINTGNFSPIANLVQLSGSAERWNVPHARGTGTYTLPQGVGLQINTSLDGTNGMGGAFGTGITAIQLDGGSIAAYLRDDSDSYATFRRIESGVSIELLSDSSIGEMFPVTDGLYDNGSSPYVLTEGDQTDFWNIDNFFGAILEIEGAISGSADLTKIGRDAITLSGANTYRNTRVESGILRIGRDNALPGPHLGGAHLGAGMGDLTLEASAKFDLNGYHQELGNLKGPGGILYNTASSYNTLTLNSPASADFGGEIRGTIDIVKKGAGTQGLTYAGYDADYNAATTGDTMPGNTYLGTTRIEGGALYAIDGAGVPVSSPIILAGGVFETTGTFNRSLGTSGDSVVSFAAGGGGFSARGGALNVTLGGAPGPLKWNETPHFAGDGSPLKFGSLTADNVVTFTNNVDLNGAVREIHAVDNIASLADIAVLSGALSDSAGAGGGLLKTGDGTVVLTGTNTYTGPTTVNTGTLLIDGDHSLASGEIAIESSGTLGGIGTIGGPVTAAGGTLTAGTATGIGTLTLNGSVSTTSSSVWLVNLVRAVGGDANGGAQVDLLALGGGASFTSLGDFTLLIDDTGLPGVDDNLGDKYQFASFDPAIGWDGTLFNGGSLLDNSYVWGMNGSQFQIDYDSGSGAFFLMSAVPEPETWLPALLILVLGLSLRRRRLA